MEIEWTADALAKLLGPGLAGVATLCLKAYLAERVKLVWYLVHASATMVRGTGEQADVSQPIHTHLVIVRNEGKKTARNVRLTHANLPNNVTIHPQIEHNFIRRDDGSGEIVFPTIVPREQVTVSYLYFPPLIYSQVNSQLKSDDGFAKFIEVIPIQKPNKLLVWSLQALAFIGASFLLFWGVRATLLAL